MSELVVIFALVLVNGLFAGAEIAVVALRKARMQSLAEEGDKSARAVLTLRDDPERFLATVQVGITVVSATAAAFAGASVAEQLAPHFTQLPWLGQHAQTLAFGVVVAGISYLSIVVGELVPKSLALRGAERYALLIGRPLLALAWLASPIVWLLSSSANVVLRPFGDRTTFTEARHSAEELQELVEEATKAGTIHPEAGEIAARALELPELTAADVMVLRQDVVMIARNASVAELERVLLEHPHNRMPVYEDRVDNVVGYVSVKDLLSRVLRHAPIVLEELLRAPFFVPESKRAVELMQEMRSKHLPFAIVVDEAGGTSGIITMEDLVEELVGEIFSEHTRAAPTSIEREPSGSALVLAATPIREINRALGLDLPEDGDWSTLAGLCLALAGRVPSAGERFELASGVGLEVVDASLRRVRSVRIHRPAETADG